MVECLIDKTMQHGPKSAMKIVMKMSYDLTNLANIGKGHKGKKPKHLCFPLQKREKIRCWVNLL
jgi:hypothetical protein